MLIWAEAPQLPGLIDSLAGPAEFRCDDPAIDLALLRDADRALLFTANPTSTERPATLRFDRRRTLRGAWGGDETLCGDGSISITLAPYSARIWEVSG